MTSKLHQLEDDFLECRRRHRWSDIPVPHRPGRKYAESSRIAVLASRCDRCTAIREEAWNRMTGEIMFVTYYYPDGYSLTGAKVKPWDVRREYLKRHLDNRAKVTPIRKRRAS